ncbi:retrovirus-related pol polyprotein from transposon TNT 1-94 [Tanacetum coccineum]|uniref:Retrovirus-related pol polyprotein from transposon TNT 1-94 n=1 Tax=Tanacetum coccineum TaxID=301880 RepID=A0ABQ5IYR4_9ASTR
MLKLCLMDDIVGIVAMQEELNQFIANDVWELVPQPRNMKIIGTKWVFRNKLDENVARIESIRILLAYACALDFKLFQMDVKSAFLNGFINKKVVIKPLSLASPSVRQVSLGDNQDHVPACLCYMLYYVVHFEKFNLAYFMAKRMEWVTKQKRLILPYGMLLTHLFKFVMNENRELQNESYVLYDRVMNPLTAQQERKTRKDLGKRRGRHSTSSSCAFGQASSSHLNDDDDGNNEGTWRTSTPSLIRYVNSLKNEVP